MTKDKPKIPATKVPTIGANKMSEQLEEFIVPILRAIESKLMEFDVRIDELEEKYKDVRDKDIKVTVNLSEAVANILEEK
jgi:hypothetical protein